MCDTVDTDDVGLAFLDDLTEHAPLRVEIELSAWIVRLTYGDIRAALIAATEREPFDSLVGAAIVKDENRTAPSGKPRGRDQRAEHRVLVVFAHLHDPHIDVVFAHETLQYGFEPLYEPLLTDLHLLA